MRVSSIGNDIDVWDFNELAEIVSEFENYKHVAEGEPKRPAPVTESVKNEPQSKENKSHSQAPKIAQSVAPTQQSRSSSVLPNKRVPSNNNQENQLQNSPEINLVYLRKDKKGNFIFKVFPNNLEIVRSINDIYNLRASLILEFPFYYVNLKDSPSRRKRQPNLLCQHFLSSIIQPALSGRVSNHSTVHRRFEVHQRHRQCLGCRKRSVLNRCKIAYFRLIIRPTRINCSLKMN